MLTSVELRKKYLEFFASKGHKIISSASLIPENDPTALFTMAGMFPLVPYLLGEVHPEGNRLVNVQKCIRTGDIDEVGDQSHVTFLEMLGNWSLGDYFKKEAIEWSWEFLTSPNFLGIDKNKLAVTVFEGNTNSQCDDESVEIWLSVGVPKHKISYLSDNWWGPAGNTGPCGPDTEIFYWCGDTEFPPENSTPKNDESNWLEIWNNVFMQYNKTIDNKYIPLEKKNVDTGMGLERTVAVLNGFKEVYQIDTLWPLIQKIEEISGREYIESFEMTKAMRIIADHIRAAVMIMGDSRGIPPSNVDQGYIVRRLIRRAIRQGHILGIKENFCSRVAEKVIEIFKDVYSEVEKNIDFVLNEMAKEESRFRNTLERGMCRFISIIANMMSNFKDENLKKGIFDGMSGDEIARVVLHNKYTVNARDSFDLYQSYGFPIEMIIELAAERNLKVDINGFNEEMKKHQELSRLGGEQKFKGGLADNSEISTKYHTATHLLQASLRTVLGKHVEQKGSNITAERLRFDFSHPEKMTDEQKQQVEDLVNDAIKKDFKVCCDEMTVSEAKQKGAMGLFEDKYGNKVKVYSIGEVSKEICGGPHVEHTGELGKFRIIKEEASSSGVRRIKAVLE